MSGSIERLIELAGRRCDDAARALAQAARAQEDSRRRGLLLAQYRTDYRARLERVAREGIDGATLGNLRRFLARIDEAQAQQRSDEAAGEARVEQARRAWQEARTRLEAFAALGRRRAAALAQRARRIEQRAHDEAAARRHRITNEEAR
jgi:flagellar FliJ protein